MIASTYGAQDYLFHEIKILAGNLTLLTDCRRWFVFRKSRPTHSVTPTVGVSLITRSVCLSRAKVGAAMCRRPDDRLMTTGVGGSPFYTQRRCDKGDQY